MRFRAPWYFWPSWLVEMIAGLLLASVVQLLPPLSWQVTAAFFLSWFYETIIDQNAGKPWHSPLTDFSQRAAGIALGLLLWRLWRLA